MRADPIVVNRRSLARRFLTPERRFDVLTAAKLTCSYCNRSTSVYYADPDGQSWTIDHIEPITRAESDAACCDEANLTVACMRCNSLKTDHYPAELRAHLLGLRQHIDRMLACESAWPAAPFANA